MRLEIEKQPIALNKKRFTVKRHVNKLFWVIRLRGRGSMSCLHLIKLNENEENSFTAK